MGRYCRICCCVRANERFGGKGYRAYVCDRCRKLPKLEQQRALRRNEVLGFLEQKNISAKNIARLHVIAGFEDEQVAQQAQVLLEIASIKPHRRKRWGFIRASYPQLFQKAIDVGFLFPEGNDETDWIGSEDDFVVNQVNRQLLELAMAARHEPSA